jgi:hypothetical protein
MFFNLIVFTSSETVPLITYVKKGSLHSSVSIVMGCGLESWGSIPGKGRRFFSSPLCPHHLGAHPDSYPVGTRDFSPGIGGRGVEVTTDLHLLPRSRMVEPYPHSPVCLNSMVLN